MVVSKRLKWLMVGCLAMELLVIAAFLGLLIWLRTPRVRIADVEKTIGTSLPVGTPRQDVEFWLTTRSMPYDAFHDQGQQYIESWITDSGPPGGFPFGIRDIRLQFFFDENERLVRSTLKQEDRF